MASHGARTGASEDSLAYTVAKGGIISMTYYAAKILAKQGDNGKLHCHWWNL